MEILQTKRQDEDAQFASRLEILRELDKRQALDQPLKKELRKLENITWASYETVLAITSAGLKDWTIIQGLSFIHGIELITCDVLLIANNKIYTFDVDPRLRKDLTEDESARAFQKESSAPLIEEILRRANYEVDVQGYILFVQEPLDCMTAHIPAATKVINRLQLQETVEELAKQEVASDETIDSDTIFHILEREECPLSYIPEPISEDIMDKVKPGISCSYCRTFDVEIDVMNVSCKCGINEPLEEAIVRTICEYGVLNNHQPSFNPFELQPFFDGELSLFQLIYYLEKHFVKIHI